MSRIGKLPILLPSGVTAEVLDDGVTVKGPKGELFLALRREIGVENKDGHLLVTLLKDTKLAHALHGTIRARLANMVKGVSEEWTKQLELVGTGYRAEVQGKDLLLTVGYIHPVKITAPEGISFKVEKMIVTVGGADKVLVGQVAADIRKVRPPEPYKGKGIKYTDEVIVRKAGKAAKTAA